MNARTPVRCAVLILVSTLFSIRLSAQTVCDDGNGRLDPAQPSGVTPAGIIQVFAAKDAAFKAAREHYGYTLDANIQTLDSNGQVDGTYHQIWEVTFNDKGARVEKTTLPARGTLRGIAVNKEDLDDIRDRLPFMLTKEDLPQFSVTFVGQQRVDELDTYVFDVSPKDAKKGKTLFQGRVWVDDRDLMIVKTCGKTRRDANLGNRLDVTPTFATYRQEIDGQFWFPTYSRADQLLHFPRQNVYIREVVKYTNYKAYATK